jgi:hypothetical protein
MEAQMKKISMLCVLFIVTALHSFSQSENQTVNIADYFPMSVWMQWQYADIHDRLRVIATITIHDETANTALFSETDTIMGLTNKRIYLLKDNTIIEIFVATPIGEQYKNLVILDVPGKEWQTGDPKQEYTIYTSSKSPISFEGKEYTDCIRIEGHTRYFYEGKWGESRSRIYYAKGIGKVYEEIFSKGVWRPFDKLVQFRKGENK